MNPNVKALIFDCDGTLVDTMPLHMKAWEAALEKFGLVYDRDYFFSKRGMPEEEIMIDYGIRFKKNVIAADVVAAKHDYYRAHLNGVNPLQIVVDVALEYKNKLPMAIVSGGTRENVVASLEVIGIEKLFKVIITADDNIKPKPAPDKFLKAAELLAVEPKFCQVFEDGQLGIEAAKAAGMVAIDVIPYLD